MMTFPSFKMDWDKNLEEFKELMAQKDPSMRVEILENKSLKI